MDQTEKSAILELQQQVKLLTRAVIFLVALLALTTGLIPMILLAVLVLSTLGLFLLPILAFTHQWIPPLARQIGLLISYLVPRFWDAPARGDQC